MEFFNPLEQFSIEVFANYFGAVTIVAYTIIGKMVSCIFLCVLISIYSSQSVYFSNRFQKIVNLLFSFVLSIVKESIGVKKPSFVILLFIIFLFIFTSNILGMLPYSITVTSHLILTLFFSLAFFIGNNLIGAYYHKEKYFVLFLPEGVPVVIIPFLILIEYVSYISRIFSLAIRLFANMMSGHILLKILISFI